MPTVLISILLKYVLPLLGVIAIIFGVYEYGHSKGYNDGYTVAWNTQQATINKMVSAENAQADANNKQIASIEQDSFNDAFQAKVAQAKLETTRTTVIQTYTKANPQTSTTCGFDVPMVNAINAIIQADPANVQQAGDTK
jgi:hypothetical protein